MDPRTLLFVVIFGSCGIFINIVISNPIEVPDEETASNIIKILLECMHSNTETYRACLTRQKRHHHSHEINHSCMEPCVGSCIQEKLYDPDSCADSCKYCIKRQNHRKIDIAETTYETICINNNCTQVKSDDREALTVNVTAHVHIHNHYSTQTTAKQNCPCYYATWQPCYCRPSYPICQYQNQWPCIPDLPQQPPIASLPIGPPMIGPPPTGPQPIGPLPMAPTCENNDCNPATGN
nr:uncharacterized protein LOC117222853 [Megalopta genalis]